MPQFYFRTGSTAGMVTLPPGIEIAKAGQSVTANVELTVPIPLEVGQRLWIRDGGRLSESAKSRRF